jgi:hypothetical protein
LEANVKPWQRGGLHFLNSTNSFGLSSRSELNYPELYQPIDVHFWRPLTLQEQLEIIERQAAVLERVGYRDDAELKIAHSAADEAYNEATGRRNAVLRKRFRKGKRKQSYLEKKAEEEWKRTAPLTRRMVEPERRYAGGTGIVRSGALDTPIVVSGLPTVKKDSSGLPQYQDPPPPPLRVVKRRKKNASSQDDSDFVYSRDRDLPRYELPTFETRGAPKIRVQPSYQNKFGLTPREITAYPEAYRDVSAVYWRQLSQDQREQIMQVQAVAMEKVGFERGTSKHFIEDFEPAPEAVYAALVREMARPPSVIEKIAASIASLLMTLVGIAIVVGIIAAIAIFIWDWLVSFAGM